MIDFYICNLIEQYKASQGINNIDSNSKEFWNSLAEWVLLNQSIGNIYVDFLMHLEFFIMDKNYLEIGKGVHDTIISDNFDSSIITNYSESFEKSPIEKKIVKGKLYVSRNELITLEEDRKTRSHKYHNLYFINRVLTQNIYFNDELKRMIEIENIGLKVILGAYGMISDKDRISKIETLRSIKNQLIGLTEEKYTYFGDKYVYCLYSKEKYDKNRYKRTLTQ